MKRMTDSHRDLANREGPDTDSVDEASSGPIAPEPLHFFQGRACSHLERLHEPGTP